VVAFEPEAQNYALLNRNIQLNNLEQSVKAYCMGLSNQNGIFDLHIADLRAGGSCHAVGDALDFEHLPFDTKFTQGCVASRLDDLVQSGSMPMPNHIKIDVDGFEPRVIEGARETLADRRVRSLLIETNPNLQDHCDMVKELNDLGFMHDPAQVRRAERQSGVFKGVAEYVFKR
jgi:FkbM family methyltransferase